MDEDAASKSQCTALPIMEVVANNSEENSAESTAICSVCLSKVSDMSNARVLPCGHFFHETCISTWLHHSSTCPECRNSIYTNRFPTARWINDLVQRVVVVPNSDAIERTDNNFVSEINWMIFATTWIAGILVIIMLSNYTQSIQSCC